MIRKKDKAIWEDWLSKNRNKIVENSVFGIFKGYLLNAPEGVKFGKSCIDILPIAKARGF